MDILIAFLIICGFAALVFFSEMRSKKNNAAFDAAIQSFRNQIASLEQQIKDKIAGK